MLFIIYHILKGILYVVPWVERTKRFYYCFRTSKYFLSLFSWKVEGSCNLQHKVKVSHAVSHLHVYKDVEITLNMYRCLKKAPPLISETSSTTTMSGVIILVGYMSFDAFTSNWQGELFTQHKMSSVQMMCGVNFFSCLLTTTSLLQQGGFGVSLAFMFTYPVFFWDCLILSVSLCCFPAYACDGTNALCAVFCVANAL